MILSDSEIKKEIEKKTIILKPFNINNLGSNSYDVSLSENLAIYIDKKLDAKKHNKIKHFKIKKKGFLLLPGELYLGSTKEYTETHKHLSIIDGKSSVGRLGIDIHATAGIGDVGFCGHWTLEISVSKPVIVYANMPIGQIIYHEVKGRVLNTYSKKISAKYNHQTDKPRESMMWKNKF